MARGRAAGFDPLYRPAKDGFDLRLGLLRWSDVGTINKGTLALWGIELRDPLSDRRLIEACLALPTELYAHRGEPRALARAVLSDRLPAALLAERRQGLQAAGWHRRYAPHLTEIAGEIDRIANVPAAARLLDLARLGRLLEQWPDAGTPDSVWAQPVTIRDYRAVFHRGLAVGQFVRRVSGSNG